jgi:prolyl oligopeptidase
MQRIGALAIGWLATGLIASAALGQTPPTAPVRPVTDNYFGTKVVDNYRYFENLNDPEVQQWMKTQANYTDSALARIPGRAAFLARLHQLDASQRAVVGRTWRRPGDRYFYLKRLAGEPAEKLYERTGLQGRERLLVDPANVQLIPEHRGKGPSSINGVTISADGRYVVVGIAPGGAVFDSEFHVIVTATGRETGDVIPRNVSNEVAWLPGNRGFVYARAQDLPAGAPATAASQKESSYLHRLGTDPRSDRAVFGYDVTPSVVADPSYSAGIRIGAGWRYAIGVLSDGVSRYGAWYITPLDSLDTSHTAWAKVAAFSDQVTSATLHGDDLYLRTGHDASRYKILRTDARHPDLSTAETVVPASDAVVDEMDIAQDALYVHTTNGGVDHVLRVPFGPHPVVEQVNFPFAGRADLNVDPELPGALIWLAGPTQSFALYHYDAATHRLTDTNLQPKGPFDRPSTITLSEVEVTSWDGTKVPLTIVYPKGMKMDGSHPTMLMGYGAYGDAIELDYDPTEIAEFERGAVLAGCHVRGGGEHGEEWHLAGQKLTKPNTWKDFIACAEYLIAKGYTSPAHLAGQGGSAGGILIGRAIEERPDLFAAAIANVPLADGLRSETTANGVPNIAEFGSTKTEEGFRALYAMSPYANVKDGVKYPAVLVATGMNDPRVPPWEPAKFAARLQAATVSGKPVLLQVDYRAGHGASTAEQGLQVEADWWSFILWQTGDAAFQPDRHRRVLHGGL